MQIDLTQNYKSLTVGNGEKIDACSWASDGSLGSEFEKLRLEDEKLQISLGCKEERISIKNK